MKYCFFLQRRFALLGHTLALNIATKNPTDTFCGVVQGRQYFDMLSSQKELTYTSLILDEDIHKKIQNSELNLGFLKQFEKEFGVPNLWPYVYVDRVIMHGQLRREYPYDIPLLSENELLKCLQVYAQAIIEFLDREKPDVVVTSVVGCVSALMLYHIASKRGIKTLQIEFARLGTRISVTEDIKTLTGVITRFKEIQDGRKSSKREVAQTFLKDFRASPQHYDEEAVPGFYTNTGRGANLLFLKPYNLVKSVPWHIKTFFSDLKKRSTADYTDIYIWWTVWDKLKRRIRGLLGYSSFYSAPRYDQPFTYYPLHIDPEIATMLYAPFYTDQISLIRAVARSLPVGMQLYVKEHPGMVGFRTRSYYRALARIPNVRIINPNVSGLDLAREAALTVTITSTNALESIFFKKPIITFGDVFFNSLPGVERCTGFEQLPYLVQKQLEIWEHDEENLINLVSAVLEDSVDVDFSALWNRGATLAEMRMDQGMVRLADKIREIARSV